MGQETTHGEVFDAGLIFHLVREWIFPMPSSFSDIGLKQIFPVVGVNNYFIMVSCEFLKSVIEAFAKILYCFTRCRLLGQLLGLAPSRLPL